MADIDDRMLALLERLQEELPAIFRGSQLDHLTAGAICWGTIQNKRSRGEIPANCFLRSGPRVIIDRDPFLKWWVATLQPTLDGRARYTPRSNSRRKPLP